NFGNPWIGCQRTTDFNAVAIDDIQYTGWQDILNQFGQYQNTDRRLFGRFEHNTVARCEGRRQFPGCHQDREVPGNDLTDHTERFVEMVGNGIFINFRNAAFLRTDTPGKVTEMVDT